MKDLAAIVVFLALLLSGAEASEIECLPVPFKVAKLNSKTVEAGISLVEKILEFESLNDVTALQPAKGYVGFIDEAVTTYRNGFDEPADNLKWQILQSYYCTKLDSTQ